MSLLVRPWKRRVTSTCPRPAVQHFITRLPMPNRSFALRLAVAHFIQMSWNALETPMSYICITNGKEMQSVSLLVGWLFSLVFCYFVNVFQTIDIFVLEGPLSCPHVGFAMWHYCHMQQALVVFVSEGMSGWSVHLCKCYSCEGKGFFFSFFFFLILNLFPPFFFFYISFWKWSLKHLYKTCRVQEYVYKKFLCWDSLFSFLHAEVIFSEK